MPARNITGRRAGRIGEDHDRKLEPLRSMHRHHPNTLRALLDDGRILGLTGFCVRFHALHEGAERGRATLFETSRHVDHSQAVRQRLLARWPHRNSRMRPDRVQQHQYRLADGAAVAPDVKVTQQSKRVGNLLCSRLELRLIDGMHGVESTYLQLTIRTESLPIDEQGVVAEREQRSPEGRIDPQLVIRPFDRGKGIAQRDDLLAIMKRATAHENVGEPSRFQRTDVRSSDVGGKIPEAPKQNANVAR